MPGINLIKSYNMNPFAQPTSSKELFSFKLKCFLNVGITGSQNLDA